MHFQSTKNSKKIFHTTLDKIFGDCHILKCFFITTELDYYHQKKNVRVATRVDKRLQT